MTELKKAVVLAEGPSLKEYKESSYKDAFIIGVNTAYHSHKRANRKYPRLDLILAMDAPRHFRKSGKYEDMIATPESIPMRLQNREWEAIPQIKKRDNVEFAPSTRVRVGDERMFWKYEAINGGTTAIAGVYYAIREGYNEVYVFGHDFSKDWYGYNDHAAQRTIKELNFAHSIAKKKGGGVYVCEGSHLWELEFTEGEGILRLDCFKTEKPKAKPKAKIKEI